MLGRRNSRRSDPNKWLLGKFLEFVESGIWTIPIATFVEQQSVVFDRQQGDESLYLSIHAEFASLIDTLITCFCEDMEVTTEKLAEALQTLSHQNLTVKQRIELEPIAAAQDFKVFVPMMMRKNVELQLQALQMIEFMCGLIPNILQLEDGETLRNMKEMTPEVAERWVLISVMRQSKEEFERAGDRALREHLEEMAREGMTEKQKLERDRDEEEKRMKDAIGNSSNVPISYAAAVSSITSTESRGARPPSRWMTVGSVDPNSLVAPLPLPLATSSDRGIVKEIANAAHADQRPISKQGGSSEKNVTNETELKSQSDNKRKPSKSGSRGGIIDATTANDANKPENGTTSYDAQSAEILNEMLIIGDKGDSKTSGETAEQQRPKSKRNESSENQVSKEIETKRPSSKKKNIKTEDNAVSEDGAVIPDSNKSNGDKSRQPTVNGHRPRSKERIARRDSRESAPVATRAGSGVRRDGSQSRQKRTADEAEAKKLNNLKQKRLAGPNKPLPHPNERVNSPLIEYGPRRRNLDDVNSHLVDGPRLNSSDVAQRAAYLREQRDKLLELKRKERQKQINELTVKMASERPKTAKAVRGAMQAEEESKTRKAIAEKIKHEIQIESIHSED